MREGGVCDRGWKTGGLPFWTVHGVFGIRGGWPELQMAGAPGGFGAEYPGGVGKE
ncbi:hypothetical protein D3C81_2164140 [compost metagenome]